MLLQSRQARRRGAGLVEAAIVLPLTFLLVIGVIVGALGVFRSQETAELARAAARYASVRGGWYKQEGKGTLTKQQIIDAAIKPRAASLEPLTVTIQIVLPDNTVKDWDDSYWNSHDRTYTIQSGIGTGKYNRVRVKLTYAWKPEAFKSGTINLTSTSEIAMSY